MLQNWGMVPVACASSEQAITLLREQSAKGTPFQLILSDVQMPDVDGFMMAEQIRDADEAFHDVPIIMLTSATRMGDVKDRERLKIAGCIMKPVTQSELFNLIIDVMGLSINGDANQSNLHETPPEVFIQKKLNVLLVEDNKVNQTLAIRMLEKQGHHVDLAENGEEAVTMSGDGNYDLILMDVQMPIMDGLDATREIRTREEQGEGHVKIVAMTAHAMKGDRELCVDAGMDDYLSKPIRIKEFSEKLKSLFGTAEMPSTSNSKSIQSAIVKRRTQSAADTADFGTMLPLADGHVEWELAAEATGNDPDLLRELVGVFLDELPDLLTRLSLSVDQRDANEIRKSRSSAQGLGAVSKHKAAV